jgi:integrase
VVEDRGRLTVGSTKSYAGARLVAVPSIIAPDLRSHLEWFAEPGKNGRVFVGPKNATPRRANLNRIWRTAVMEAGVQGLHLHDLRHIGNTLAAMTGASLRELMERAGHSSTRAAIGYLQAVKDRDRAIADGLSELVRRSRTEKRKQRGRARRGSAGRDAS